MKNQRIYLDYAATTPFDSRVLKTMLLYLKDKYGNPSSIHSFGQEAAQAVDEARIQVAKFLNCKPSEIVFTGSASESDNLAIRGLVKKGDHIITTKIEHKAVLETCKDLESKGIKATYLSVNKEGLISIKDLEKSIRPNTKLVSIMYANNETGVVQPIKKIKKLIKNIYFHTDAVQAGNWLNCDINDLGVDLLTLSGHKIYGPKGVGILYIRKGTPIKPIVTGGDHEWGLRAGTENVAAIAGLGTAIAMINEQRTANSRKIEKLRSRLVRGILKISGSKLNGPAKKEDRLPNIANFSWNGVEGESLVIALDQEGIAVSTGSACTSRELRPSHVLKAMGLSELEAHSSLRVSLGKHTTATEIDRFLKILPRVMDRLRKISGR
ncbi:MAG TPA: cysteine desulfurase [bacterium]|nr:cysteine desulfurase [bacterium]